MSNSFVRRLLAPRHPLCRAQMDLGEVTEKKVWQTLFTSPDIRPIRSPARESVETAFSFQCPMRANFSFPKVHSRRPLTPTACIRFERAAKCGPCTETRRFACVKQNEETRFRFFETSSADSVWQNLSPW